MFKDYKNEGRGFGLELTGLQHPERLARLLLALALVYIWLLLWGLMLLPRVRTAWSTTCADQCSACSRPGCVWSIGCETGDAYRNSNGIWLS